MSIFSWACDAIAKRFVGDDFLEVMGHKKTGTVKYCAAVLIVYASILPILIYEKLKGWWN